jgi:tRNA(Ile)-lysidine synthetase-like protein
MAGLSVGEARRTLRGLIERAGGLRAVSAHHVETLRSLCAKAHASGQRLPLPGRREALVSFGELRVGPAAAAAAAYEFPLSVPGRVELPGGRVVCAAREEAPVRPGAEEALVAAPSGRFVVRTRRPGDRIQDGAREISLKRFLMRHRIPSTERGRLPLVASGHCVVWIPGRVPAARPSGGTGAVRLSLERTA